MFTGLIREFGTVVSYGNNILTLKAKYRPKIGDSIAVNGACLTVISLFDDGSLRHAIFPPHAAFMISC